MEDIKSGKDGVSYVLVFKLSRFGRNAADVLATLQVMQDFGVNLICVEDGIDSSRDAGKLMISVLSAVAEIERENIRVQTMEGRMQKAREGKWNGGFAPYGYSLIDGKLEVNEEEAVAIRTIFDQYVNTDLGANEIAKYLENHRIHKIARQNGKNPLFDAALIRRIIQNPVYCGKISYGKRRTEKVHGTMNEYRQVKTDDYLLVDGLHEALVSEEVWEQAQAKVAAQAKKYEKVNRDKVEKIYLLSGILKCPVCGAGMYGNKAIKKRKDGSNYKDFYYYGCKHRNMTRGHKCDYKKQVHEEMLDASVAEVISKLVSNPKFSDLIRNKINMEVDTSALDQEIENYKIQLRKLYHNKDTILSDMDSLDYEDKHYQRRKTDLENHLYKTYDKIDGAEKREFLSQLVDNVQIYDLCSARTEVERRMVDNRKVKVDFSLEDMDLSEFKGKATYEQIKAYVLEQTGLKVSSLYIAQIKKKCGLDVDENFNLAKSENARQPKCTPEKEEAIMQAFKHFGIV